MSDDDVNHISNEPLTPAENKRLRVLMRDLDRADYMKQRAWYWLRFGILLPAVIWTSWQFIKDVFHIK